MTLRRVFMSIGVTAWLASVVLFFVLGFLYPNDQVSIIPSTIIVVNPATIVLSLGTLVYFLLTQILVFVGRATRDTIFSFSACYFLYFLFTLGFAINGALWIQMFVAGLVFLTIELLLLNRWKRLLRGERV